MVPKYIDATLLPLGIAGQILMTYGMRSQWIIWIINDIVNVMIFWGNCITVGAGAVTMLKLRVELDRRWFQNVSPLLPQEFTLVQALDLFQTINIKRYAEYISSSVRASLGTKAIKIGIASIDGVGKPKSLYKLK